MAVWNRSAEVKRALGRIGFFVRVAAIVGVGAGAALSLQRWLDRRHDEAASSVAWDATTGRLPALAGGSAGGEGSAGPSAVGPAAGGGAVVVSDFAHPVDAVAAFDGWVNRFLTTTDPGARGALIAEGVALARARHEALYALIAEDPALALAQRVPWAVRRSLPPEVAKWLEAEVSGIGDYLVLGAIPEEGAESTVVPIRREAVIGDKRYTVFPYGRRERMTTRRGVGLHGMAVGDRLALLDSPVRVLDPGEPPPRGRVVEEVCAVSGKRTDLDAPEAGNRVAVDTGDRIVYLCSAGHVAAFSEMLPESGDLQVSPDLGEARVDPEVSRGVKRVLFIRVRFADQAEDFEPQSAIGIYGMVDKANAFFTENSGGQFRIEATVTPVYRLPESARWYQENDTSGFANNVLEAARAVAKKPQSVPGNDGLEAFAPEDYDFEVVRYAGGPGRFLGQAHIGERGVWLKTDSAGVLAHEIGHNIGLWHANLWLPDEPMSVVGPGSNQEYGDGFDSMSRNSGGHWHFNTFEKWKLHWLPDEAVQVVASDGVYTVAAHDVAGDTAGIPRALTIRRDDDRWYWLELRQHEQWRTSPWVWNGLGVRWDPWEKSNGGTQLIDTMPMTANGIMDSPVAIGRTFADATAALWITPIGKVESGEAKVPSVNVRVAFGAASDNRAPELELARTEVEADVGESVVLRVRAHDPDGDAVNLFWDFGDGSFGANAAVVTKSWAHPGIYRVRVVASDGRGGRRSTSLVARVGGGPAVVIAGVVTDLDGRPVDDAWVSAAADDHYRTTVAGGWTDSDGHFLIAGTFTEPVTLQAAKMGWRFVPEGFLNPVDPRRTAEGEETICRFVGVRTGHVVSGLVRDGSGLPVARALVRMGGQVEATGEDGAFSFVGVENGRYCLVAEKAGRELARANVEVLGSDVGGVLLQEERFTVSGEIKGFREAGNITVSNGVRSTVAVLQGTGAKARLVFALTGVPRGRWHLRVYQDGESYSPEGFRNPVVVDGNVSGLVFRRDPERRLSLSGRVTDGVEGIEDVYVLVDGRSATTDSRGNYHIDGLAPGRHEVRASAPGHVFEPASRTVEIADERVVGCDFLSRPANQPPVIVQAPSAEGPFAPGLVRLHVEAEDDGGSEWLRYSWYDVGSGPAPVAFVWNNAHGAADTIAQFAAAGTYRLRVVVTDANGATAEDEVWVNIPEVPVELDLALGDETGLVLGDNVAFRLDYRDQFGVRCTVSEPLPWSVSGGGVVSPDGEFVASEAGEGFVVRVRYGGRETERTFGVGYPEGPGTGITQDLWTGVAGSRLAALRALPEFPDKPGYSGVVGGGFDMPSGMEHNYGQRVRGYFVPPADGEYVFYLTSDNESELWLATTSDPADRRLIASVTGAVEPDVWDALPGQVSAPVELRAGRPVYIEALHKEDGASDHLRVGVRLPGGVMERPIPAHRLLPWGAAAFAPPTIEVPAHADPAIVGAGLEARLSVVAASEAGAENLTYAWRVDGAAPGPVVFLPNGTNEAATTTVRFSRPGNFRLVVAVRDSAGQQVESSVEVQVRETMAAWRARHFAPEQWNDPALERRVWGAESDPDGDGVINLLEYAFGMDPLTPDAEALPEPRMVTVDGVEYLAVAFRENREASDLVITPQVSSDLEVWEAGLVRMDDLPDGRSVYRDFRPAAESAQRFVRVHVRGP